MAEQKETDPYDLGDTGFQMTADAPPPKQTPPKDPATGRFVKQDAILAPPEVPAKPTHPDWLVRSAREYGLDEADLETMTPDQLSRTVNAFHKQHIVNLDRMAKERVVSDHLQPTRAEPTPEPAFDLGVDLSQYDEGIQKAFSAIAKRYEDRIKALEEKFEGVTQREQLREGQTATERIDNAFEALGKDYTIYFGEGAGAEFDNNSAEMKRRLAVIQSAGLTSQDMASQKVVARKLRQAAEVLYPKPQAKPEPAPAPKPTNGRAPISQEEWLEGATARPTQQNGAPEPKGEALAKANLEKNMRERGMLPSDSQIMEGLLP